MKKDVLIISSIMTIILIIISFLYDKQIIIFIASLRNNILDYFFISLSFIGSTLIIFFFLTTLFLWKDNKRKWILPLWLSGSFAFLIGFLIKITTNRPRPFHEGSVSILQIIFHFIKNNFNTWNSSLPSFQAILVFSTIPIINKDFKKFKSVWLIFAILVSFSGVYFGAHYLSDILIGALIGYLIGTVMVFLEEKYHFGSNITRRILH